MKIIYTLVLVAFAGLYSAFSQGFTLSDANGAVANGDTVFVHGLTTASLIEAPVYVTNTSATDTIHLKVKKFVVDTLTGTANMFCFGLCYPASVYTSPSEQAIPPATTFFGNGFDGEYVPYGVEGTTKMRYKIYNVNNMSDTVSFYVFYNASVVSVEELTSTHPQMSLSPNPAQDNVSLTYNVAGRKGNASVKIITLLGQTVFESVLEYRSTSKNLNIENLQNGIYLCNVLINGQVVVSKKLIIRH